MARQRNKKTRNTRNSASPQNKLWLLLPLLFSLAIGWYYTREGEDLWDQGLLRDRTIFKIVDIPGKGKGALAVRDIEQGELIIEEKPIALIPSQIESTWLDELVANLTSAQQVALLTLSAANLPAHVDTNITTQTRAQRNAMLVAIINTNGVVLGDDLIGIFPRMARLNHACAGAFNSEYAYIEEENLLQVRALKPIKRGEEVLDVYMDTLKPREDRISFLQQQYGFTCSCAVCMLPHDQSAKSDERLSKMASNNFKVKTWQSDRINGSEAIQLVRDTWSLGEEEGFYSQRGAMADTAGAVAAAYQDTESMKAWAKLAVKWYGIEVGPNHKDTRNQEKYLKNPKDHPLWATKDEVFVGGPLEGTR